MYTVRIELYDETTDEVITRQVTFRKEYKNAREGFDECYALLRNAADYE